MKLYLFLKYSLGEDACLPAQSATVVTLIDDSISEGHEGVFSSTAKPAEVKFVHKKRVSSDDVLKMQFECLCCQKENFLLKKQKLQLQIQLLQQQVNTSFASHTFNADSVVVDFSE